MYYFVVLKYKDKYIDGEFIPADAGPVIKIALRHVLPQFRDEITGHIMGTFKDEYELHESDIYKEYISIMDDKGTGRLDLDEITPAFDAFINRLCGSG